MSPPLPLIVVDGGGTGTRLRAIGNDGTVLATATAGPSNLTYGVAAAWRNVGAGLDDLARQTGRALKGTRLWCGFAGGRSPARQAAFRAADPVGATEIAIVTDGMASLIGAHGGRPGIVLAVGTGVAAFALRPDGAVVSSSAWGYKIGDEGSGGWIGRRAVACLARHLDGRAPDDSRLFATLRATVGADFNAIQTWLAEADATRFASLAPQVVAAANAGDALAEGLMTEAAEELALAIRAIDAGQPIALLGGLAAISAQRLPADLRARIVAPRGGALDGLQIMARHGWRDEDRVAFETAP